MLARFLTFAGWDRLPISTPEKSSPSSTGNIREINEGIDDSLRRAFIVYLLSHNRPMAEILAPSRKPLEDEFPRGFDGMSDQQVQMEDLTEARETLIAYVVGQMPDPHRRFILAFKRGEPAWPLLAVQQNIETLKAVERAKLVSRLENALSGYGTTTRSSGA